MNLGVTDLDESSLCPYIICSYVEHCFLARATVRRKYVYLRSKLRQHLWGNCTALESCADLMSLICNLIWIDSSEIGFSVLNFKVPLQRTEFSIYLGNPPMHCHKQNPSSFVPAVEGIRPERHKFHAHLSNWLSEYRLRSPTLKSNSGEYFWSASVYSVQSI